MDPNSWPTTDPTAGLDTDLEERCISRTHLARPGAHWDLLDKYSCLTRLLRVTTYCFRFASNSRCAPDRRTHQPLSSHELDGARKFWIREAQRKVFNAGIEALRVQSAPSRSSRLIRLRPFLDSDGLLRVGGRLHYAHIPWEERHPAILPKDSRLAILLVEQAHHTLLHAGAQLTAGYLKRRYWILGGRSLIRATIRRCPTCIRAAGRTLDQLMGNLPQERVVPSRPFLRTGVDYAGPIQARTTKGRGHRSYKAYIAVFVCMTTRAVHLEAVTDCSTSGFLAAFRRFTSQRGVCAELWSDHGSNFKGANTELRNLLLAAKADWRHLADLLATEGTNWRFSPPAAPHFGGILEAAVKSAKNHLKRVIGEHTLTYEELATLLAQIEACLNTRPIAPLTEDPDDLAPPDAGSLLGWWSAAEPTRTGPARCLAWPSLAMAIGPTHASRLLGSVVQGVSPSFAAAV